MITKLIYRLKFLLTYDKEKKILAKFIRSLPERSWDQSVISSVISSDIRTSAATEHYSLPASLQQGGKPSWIRSSKTFDTEYIYVLSDVFVSSSTGAVWLTDGRIIGESYGSLSRVLANNSFQLDYFSSPTTLNEEVVVLPSTGGFFHFMFEVLPAAIVSLNRFPHFKLLIPAKAPAYVRMFANLIGGSEPIVATGALRVPRIVVAGKTPYSGFVQKAEIERIQSFFREKFPLEKPEIKIYISRSKDKRRELENEGELEEQLLKMGFKSYVLQDLAVSDQIKLFRKAKAVISPHGAGLSNLVWSNTGIAVIEIFPFKPRNDCYSRLCINLALDYQFFVCQESIRSSGIIPIADVLRAAALLK